MRRRGHNVFPVEMSTNALYRANWCFDPKMADPADKSQPIADILLGEKIEQASPYIGLVAMNELDEVEKYGRD